MLFAPFLDSSQEAGSGLLGSSGRLAGHGCSACSGLRSVWVCVCSPVQGGHFCTELLNVLAAGLSFLLTTQEALAIRLEWAPSGMLMGFPHSPLHTRGPSELTGEVTGPSAFSDPSKCKHSLKPISIGNEASEKTLAVISPTLGIIRLFKTLSRAGRIGSHLCISLINNC